MIEPWLDIKGIQKHLGVSKETIYRMVYAKKIPVHRIGKVYRFKASEVDKAVVKGKLK
jgi:excisionase family DNA binding protein